MDDALYAEMFELENHFWWFVAKRNIILKLLDRYVRVGRGRRPRICDVGCGCGALLNELAKQYQAIGVDSSPVARSFCAKRGLEVLDGTLPDRLPTDPDGFDAVILSDVLEHVAEDSASVAAVAGLLRPGGLVVCTVPAHPWMWSPRDVFHHHKRRYRRGEFAALFDPAVWETRLLSYYNVGLFPVMVAARQAARLRGESGARPDLQMPPSWLNALLRGIFQVEKHCLGRIWLPMGASLISIHARRSGES